MSFITFVLISNLSFSINFQNSTFFKRAPEDYRQQYYDRLFKTYKMTFEKINHSFDISNRNELISIGHRIKESKRIGGFYEISNESANQKPKEQLVSSESSPHFLKPYSTFATQIEKRNDNNQEVWILYFDVIPARVFPSQIRKIVLWHEKEFYQSLHKMIFFNKDEYAILF